MAADLVLPSVITDGAANTAATLMGDLNAIVTWINANALHIDGTKALTGRLSSPNTDPVSANEFARKAYGDAFNTAEVAAQSAGDNKPPKYGCSLVASGSFAQNVPSNFSYSEVYDTDNFFGGSGDLIFAPSTGVYLFTVTSTIASNEATTLYVNSVAQRPMPSNGSTIIRLTANDVVQWQLKQFATPGSASYSGTVIVRKLSA